MIHINRYFRLATPYVAHLHLKDMRPQDAEWVSPPPGGGITCHRSIYKSIFECAIYVPMSIEIPLRFKRRNNYTILFDRRMKLCSRRTIRQILKASKDFVEQHLGPILPVESTDVKRT